LNALAEPRLASHRRLEIIGFSEVREEAEVATARAEKVREWLIEHGAAEDGLILAPSRSEEKRGSRRVEMRLSDSSGRVHNAGGCAAHVVSDAEGIRSHAKELLKPPVLNSADQSDSVKIELKVTSDPLKSLQSLIVPAAENQTTVQRLEPVDSLVGGAQDSSVAPHVLVEEVPSENGAGGRKLRITFASPTLDANDAELELGEQAVRLASASHAWQVVEAPFPFLVDPSTASAPKFSKKKGTLTLYLSGA
jgi:hypothetical protein